MTQPTRLQKALTTKAEINLTFTAAEKMAADCELNLATREAGEEILTR